ncbi:alanine/glycine:cation symporter family protein [Bariatricus sp. SGI.154]|uniref:alanine/glycine:cation symporter family protein n=1 Tax=Bariatricus sp. SGI.154 TaxID=3420549 RepID=UPI003D05A4D7
METLMTVLEKVQSFIWGPPTLILLMGTGLYFTYRLKGLQLLKFPKAMRSIFEKEEGAGDVSAFATLCTTLAADIGTGSIVGVATALRIGGPGAMFWMWVSAILGMTTKYAEALLAVKYRITDENGQIAGGPMYYIQNGMGEKFKWLAKLFAFFGIVTALLGCGTFPQVNAITESVSDSFGIPVIVIGVIVTILTAVVTLGGIQSISKVAQFVVPFMAIFFIGGSFVILAVNYQAIPGAFGEIFRCAFSKESALGGAAGTGVITFMTAMRTGVARGVYTNEAGLGSSPIVAAAAKTNSCVKQGLISMTSVFFTTLVTCSMTGLVIISSGLLDNSSLSGSVLVTKAYNMGLPFDIGMYMVAIGIIFFSFTTILGWNYYGERCMLYLTGSTKSIKGFKVVYILAIAVAPFLTLEPIWLLADITNALMIIPNLIALIGLRKVVVDETEKYFDREERTKIYASKTVTQ